MNMAIALSHEMYVLTRRCLRFESVSRKPKGAFLQVASWRGESDFSRHLPDISRELWHQQSISTHDKRQMVHTCSRPCTSYPTTHKWAAP